MKVLCIAHGDYWRDSRTGKFIPGPIYLEECTVIDSFEEDNSWYYKLAEYPPEHPDDGFEARWFVEINSGICETEMERETIKQKELV